MTQRIKQRLRNAPALERMLFRTQVTDGCWLWLGATDSKGYGTIRTDMAGPVVAVHRLAYSEMVAPIPEGLEIDHLCRVRNCVNPDHLEPVTHVENVRRGVHRNSLKTHCQRGHEFSPENTYTYNGSRTCRACNRDRYHERKAAS